MQKTVYIILFDRNGQKPHFFADSKNHHSPGHCAKITLLTRLVTDLLPKLKKGMWTCFDEAAKFFQKGY